jgi:predicted MFS family arabinose efflux permease
MFVFRAINRYQPGVWLITGIGFLNSIAYSISLPFLALYLYEKRGLSMTLVGLIVLIGGLCAGVFQLFAGVITDRIGRKPLLLITVPASIVLYAGLALLIGYSAPIIIIALFTTLVRVAITMQRPAINASVADLAPKALLTEAYGLMIIGGNLGFAAGTALGGYVAAVLDYAWVFGMGALVIVLAFILIVLFFRESMTKTSEKISIGNMLSAGKDKNLLVFAILTLLVLLGASQLSSTLSVYTVSYAGFSTSQFGFLLTLNGLIIVVFQYPFSRIMGRFAPAASLVIGACLYGIGWLTLSWVGAYTLAIGSVALVTVGEILFSPTTAAVVGRLAASDRRGRYMGFFGLAETLGWSIGPLLGGLLLDHFATRPLLVWGLVSILPFAAAIGFSRFKVK